MAHAAKILHLGKSPQDRAFVRGLVSQAEVEVELTEAGSLSEFRDLLAAKPFDLLLTDYQVEDEDPHSALDLFRSSQPGKPVIIITGSGSEAVAVEAMKRGAADYLTKNPDDLARLPGCILTALTREKTETQKELDFLKRTLKAAQGMAKLGYWRFDIATQRPIWSDEMYPVFGMKQEDGPPTYADHQKTWHPDDWEMFDTAVKKCAEGIPYDLVVRVWFPEEECYHHIRSQGYPLENDQGEINQLFGTSQDVTDSTRVMGDLENQREMLADAERLAGVGSWVWDITEDRWTFSESWKAIHGFAGSPVTSEELLQLAHPEDRETIRKAFDAAISGQQSYSILHRIVRPDTGEVRLIQAMGEVSTDTAGQPIKMVGAALDITERSRAEEDIRFRSTLLNTVGQAVITTDLDGRVIYANQAAEQLYGWSFDVVRGQSVMDLNVPAASKGQAEEIMAALRAGQLWSGEFEVKRTDGSTFPALVTNAPVCDDEGNLTGIIGVSTDITELKNVERQLRENESNLKAVFDNSFQMFFLLSADARILTLNKLARDYIRDLKGCEVGPETSLLDLVRPEEMEGFKANFARALAGESVVVEISLLYGEDTRFFKFNYNPVVAEDGSVNQVVLTVLDVTHERQYENSMRENEQFANAIANATKTLLYVFDYQKQRNIWANEAHQEFFREITDDSGSMTQDQIMAACHPDDREILIEKASNPLGGLDSGVRSLELRFAHGGGWKWMNLRLSVYKFDDQGGVQQIIGALFDIDERKRAEAERKDLEEQLVQAQKLESIGRLAGGVAHDFNNMLAVILGHSEAALEEVSGHEGMRAHLQEIIKAASSSAELTRQLLSFARRQTASPLVVDLNQTVQSIILMLGRLIGENIELTWRPVDRAALVRIDPVQVDQILTNLVVNARDAIEGGGHIRIETELVNLDEAYCERHPGSLAGRFVKLSVSDDGSGMPADVRANIFEPFFSTKEVGEGTGLGLATVYGIVKQNHGFIEVFSQPELGSNFHIYLPEQVGATVTGPVPEAPTKAEKQASGTIMYVEDEPALLLLGKTMLESAGYRVLAAGSPHQGLAMAGEGAEPIQMLVTDVIMPGMNGRQLAREMAEIYPGLATLFISGYSADVINPMGEEDDLNFLAKPFTKADLLGRVRDILARQEALGKTVDETL